MKEAICLCFTDPAKRIIEHEYTTCTLCSTLSESHVQYTFTQASYVDSILQNNRTVKRMKQAVPQYQHYADQFEIVNTTHLHSMSLKRRDTQKAATIEESEWLAISNLAIP